MSLVEVREVRVYLSIFLSNEEMMATRANQKWKSGNISQSKMEIKTEIKNGNQKWKGGNGRANQKWSKSKMEGRNSIFDF